ncbi:class I adenylate-forming enzyme family protein [Robertmurraya kyonggiensis]|uniref:Long-chain fatty acid--CoA ligase n=1 Tax=Robertmurraya kyonggiensis TaxID=1037680 RepID=A0A4U1D9C4_9BACI|nr:AMP-binding protein [Robertmurraya kyonggiensis]TKC19101.1 long-chain fatty acid--CoA ligase [Robertmurraya kyonggiensis]
MIKILLKHLIKKNRNKEKVAIKFGNRTITYRELYSLSKQISCLIEGLGKYAGNNIGIFLPNSIDYAIAYFSITMNNKVIVPISVQSKELELKSTLSYCEIRLILTNNSNLNNLINHLQGYKYKVVIINIESKLVFQINPKHPYITITDINEPDTDAKVAIMLHTSGTTSNPKRVMLTHKNLISNVESNIQSLNLTENDVVLIVLPMLFGYCNTAQFLTHLYLGATIVIMDKMFLPKSFFSYIEKEKITNFTAVPSMLQMLISFKSLDKYDISSLRHICFGGGSMPLDKLNKLISMYPSIGFVQTYGQTEAGPRVTALLSGDSIYKLGSIGKPIPNVSVKIVNENNDELSVHEVGEIIVSSQSVMRGYYKNNISTEEVLCNGWLHTGDLGFRDDEGYYYFVGRKKNVVISGGLNIYPEEVEEILLRHPDIKEARVYGEDHELLGEWPVANIILEETSNLSDMKIYEFCKGFLSDYKIPKRFYKVEVIPKTSTGKMKRIN